MSQSRPDTLLMAAKFCVAFLMTLASLVAVAVGVAALVLLSTWAMHQPDLIQHITMSTHDAPLWQIMTAILLILALIVAMAIMAVLWLRALQAIIGSVSHGDPFEPANADRLSRMGWLTISIELLSIPVGATGEWLASTFKDATADFSLSLSGLLLAMVLFILARVFAEGSRMRAELEGTV
jgi:hypothetical protein